MFALNGDGPLAQLAEQGTFNPKVAGSIPSRPTTFPASLRRFAPHGKGLRLDGPTCGHAAGQWAIVQRQDSGFWFQLSRFESWWPSHFAFLSPLGAIFLFCVLLFALLALILKRSFLQRCTLPNRRAVN